MTELFSDADLRAAFQERAAGAGAPDLFERIDREVVTTRQVRRLIVLPGLGVGASVRQLGWAAAIGASTLAIIGSMLAGGGAPRTAVVPPLPSTPPAGSTPTPTLQPVVSVRPGAVIAVAGPRAIDLQSGPDRRDSLASVPAATTLFVVDGPTAVSGTEWYQVKPFTHDGLDYPLGWIPASRDGSPTFAVTAAVCPSGDLTPTAFLALGPTGALACFGDDVIRVRGHIACDESEVVREVTGAAWLDDPRFCRFIDAEGEPYFEIFGMPWDELPPNWRTAEMFVSGHLDDPRSGDCRSTAAPPLGDDEAVLRCRTFFIVSGVAAG